MNVCLLFPSKQVIMNTFNPDKAIYVNIHDNIKTSCLRENI